MTDNRLPLIRIIDDNDVMRSSLIFLLEEEDGWEVAGYKNPLEFLENDDNTRAGCILLDIRMPKMSGLELQLHLQELNVDLPIVFLSGHADVDMAVHALKRGAVDFLQKPVDDELLINALHNAVQKNLDKKKTDKELKNIEDRYNLLTQREKEVVSLAAKGLMNKVIADKLNISERTVQIHRGVAAKKLNAKTSVDFLKVLQALGLE